MSKNPPPMHGPRGGRPMHGRKAKDGKKTLKRLLGCIFRDYKLHFGAVLFFIIISTMASVASSVFIQTLIDDYVSPMVQTGSRDFRPLALALGRMAAIYLSGILSIYLYNRIMVTISQGVLRQIRNDMFSKMQTLPIRYFDTHSHGDVMSRYTNDADTLRQMISQSIPQAFSSIVTVVSVLAAMLSKSVILTGVVLVLVVVVLAISRKITGKSSKYFIAQQKSLGSVNGYIEEMMHGQKVVKVFCHEEKSKEEFDRLNDELCSNASNAHTFANILMPIMANMGHIQYVILAIVGGSLAIGGIGGLTVGTIAAFLQLSKSFTMPINNMSQQINSIIMALAGAERIFEFIDEEPEADEGYVTLVNAEYKDGKLQESEKRTGLWAWKHPHTADGSITYTPLAGDVRLTEVDFGYVPEKTVLHDVSIYAEPGQKIAFVGATGPGKNHNNKPHQPLL